MKEHIKNEIGNYINYFTSDDSERKKMVQVLDAFMNEVYEEGPGIDRESVEKFVDAEAKLEKRILYEGLLLEELTQDELVEGIMKESKE